jgi:regulator of cell morphogenesis and NO signaling
MTTIPTERSLAELVTSVPGAARVFERHGLDYCCGGGQRLDVACRDRGVDPGEIIGELADLQTMPAPAWATMGPAELVDHLEQTHHAYLHAEFPRLSALATKVVGVHGARHPELTEVQAAFEAVRADLDPHLMKEEQVLFPMIRELAASATAPQFHCGSLANPISVMLTEHDRAGELLARMRDLTDGYQTPPDGCASYRALYDGLAELEADTHLHVHKENNVLFPAVVDLEAALPSR